MRRWLLLSLVFHSAPAMEAPAGDVARLDEAQWTESVSRRRQRLGDAPQTVTVLTRDDLAALPSIELADRLRYEAGIDVYQARHGQYDVGLRGFNGLNNHRILLIVDGFQLRQEEFGMIQWVGTMSPTDMARIEIVKGPSSVVHGANAVGGVITVRGDDPAKVGGRSVRGLAGWGQHGTRELDATATGLWAERGYWKLSAGWSRRGDLPAVDSGNDHQDHARSSDSAGDDLLMGRLHALAGMRLDGDQRLELGYRANDQWRWDLVDDLDSGANDTSSFYDSGMARWRGPWGELAWQTTWTRKRYQGQKTSYVASEDYKYIQAGIRSREDQARLHVNRQIGPHQLALGTEYQRYASRSNLWNATGTYREEASWGTLRWRNLGVYLEDQWRAAADLTLTAGVRGDDHSQAGRLASPRAAANWRASRQHAFLASYSSGYRLPTPIEVGLTEFYFDSDPSLRAERTHAFELAWTGRPDPRRMTCSLAGFATRSNDTIMRMPLPVAEQQANWIRWLNGGSPDVTVQPGPFLRYTNVGNPSWLYGAEGSAKLTAPDRSWSLAANATWQRLRWDHPVMLESDGFFDPVSSGTIFRYRRDLGRDFNAPPEWKGTLLATRDGGWWFASGALRLVAARQVLSIGNSYLASSGEVAVQRIPAYAAWDAGLGWRIGGDPNRTVRLSALDLFASERGESFQSESSTLATDREDQGASLMGRRIAVVAEFVF